MGLGCGNYQCIQGDCRNGSGILMIVCYNKKGKLEGLFFNNGVLCDDRMTVTNASTGRAARGIYV